MRCNNCHSTLLGIFCHHCGYHNPGFLRETPITLDNLAEALSEHPTPATIVEHCDGNRIAAIKAYRAVSGLSLREAKEMVDIAFFEKYPERRTQYGF